MTQLALQLQTFNGVGIITMNGRLDAFTARQLHHAVQTQLHQGVQRIILHTEQVQFGSIAGVRTMLQLQQQARSRGGDLLLVSPSRPLMQVLTLTEANRLLKIYPTLNEAVSILFIGAYAS